MAMKKSYNEVTNPIAMNKYFQIHYFDFETKVKVTKLSHFVKQAYHKHSLL